MIIAFDTWTLWNPLRNSGIHRYSLMLLKELEKLSVINDSIRLRVFYANGYSDETSALSSSSRFELVPAPLLKFHRSLKLAGLATAAYRINADVIFSPTFYVCPWGPTPTVTTIHDLTPITSPVFKGRRNLVDRFFLWNAAHLSRTCIVDSECTKNDLIRIYGTDPEKVKIVYLGYDRYRFNAEPADIPAQKLLFQRLVVHSPYILHHGTIQPRKNLERLIQAYRLLMHKRPSCDASLVLAGPLGWEYEGILRTAREAGYPGNIIFTGPLSEDELPLLVKGATLCVLPSLYEGFCLPMIESMACGVPTIASNASCLPEVSGNVLRYFDPLSVDDITDKMDKSLHDWHLREELTRNGIRRAAKFSWESCAQETLRILVATYEQCTGQTCKPTSSAPV